MGTTRFYLTASAAPISPTANSGWDDATQITRGLLSPTKAGANAAITATETSTASGATGDTLIGQWVSAPMTHAGTIPIGATFDLNVARNESDAAADFTVRYGVRVVSGDGTVERGGVFFAGGSEWATTLTAVELLGSALTSAIACQVGDRLVFEYGFRAGNTVTTPFTGTIRRGGTDSTDLANGDTGGNATSRSPWVELGDEVTDLFSTAGTTAWTGTIGGTLAVEAAWGADLTADADTWDWSDLTGDVRYDAGIELTHGRGDEAAETQPATCQLVLDNRLGAYSIGPESANYPNVKRGTPIRVRVDIDDGWVTLFQGNADTWNPTWAGGPSGDATVALNASGALRRLEQGAAPVQSVFTRALAADTTTVAHWPLEDDENSDVGSSSIEDAPSMQYTGQSPTFGAGSGEFVGTASMVTLNGTRLIGEVPPYTLTSTQCIRWLASFPSSPFADGTVLARVYCPGGTAPLWEVIAGTGVSLGSLRLVVYSTAGAIIEDSGEVAFAPEGKSLLMSLEMTQDGADIDYRLATREVGKPGGLSTTGTITTDTFGAVSFVEFGPNGDVDSLAIGQVHVQDAIVSIVSGDSSLLLNAHRFERADNRIDRLCDENAVSVTFSGATSTSAVRMGPQGVGTLLELLRECEATEQGVLYDGLDPGLTYRTKGNLVGQAADITLDASAGEVDQPIPVDDDQRTRNLVVASRPNGGSATAADTTGPMGTDAIGIYDEQITVSPESDSFLPDFAQWFVHRGTIRGYRYPGVSFQLHRDPSLASTWLSNRDLGERVDITNIEDVRSQHPAGTISLSIEGYRQRLDQFTWAVDLVCSPYEPNRVALIPTESGDTRDDVWRLESDGSTLASSALAGATSLSVATPSGPLWTTTSDDFPLFIEVEGTKITVTNITGGSSPQTFTVTGSTVVRALSSGAEVTLWRQSVLALPF